MPSGWRITLSRQPALTLMTEVGMLTLGVPDHREGGTPRHPSALRVHGERHSDSQMVMSWNCRESDDHGPKASFTVWMCLAPEAGTPDVATRTH